MAKYLTGTVTHLLIGGNQHTLQSSNVARVRATLPTRNAHPQYAPGFDTLGRVTGRGGGNTEDTASLTRVGRSKPRAARHS